MALWKLPLRDIFHVGFISGSWIPGRGKSLFGGKWCLRVGMLTDICLSVVCCLVAKLCPTLCDPMGYRQPGFSVRGISQASVKWVAVSFSRLSSGARDQIWVSYITGKFFTIEPPEKPKKHLTGAKSKDTIRTVKSTNGGERRHLVNLITLAISSFRSSNPNYSRNTSSVSFLQTLLRVTAQAHEFCISWGEGQSICLSPHSVLPTITHLLGQIMAFKIMHIECHKKTQPLFPKELITLQEGAINLRDNGKMNNYFGQVIVLQSIISILHCDYLTIIIPLCYIIAHNKSPHIGEEKGFFFLKHFRGELEII